MRGVRVGNRRNLPQKSTDFLERGRGRLERVIKVRDLIDGLEEAPRIQHEGEEHAHAQIARKNAEATHDQHCRDRDIREQAQGRLVDAEHGDRVEGRAPIVFGERAVFARV